MWAILSSSIIQQFYLLYDFIYHMVLEDFWSVLLKVLPLHIHHVEVWTLARTFQNHCDVDLLRFKPEDRTMIPKTQLTWGSGCTVLLPRTKVFKSTQHTIKKKDSFFFLFSWFNSFQTTPTPLRQMGSRLVSSVQSSLFQKSADLFRCRLDNMVSPPHPNSCGSVFFWLWCHAL